jgi:hypothetical protein
MTGSSPDFNALAKVLGEVGGVEHFIFYGFGAIDGEAAGVLVFGCLFFGGVLGGFGKFWGGCCGLLCGHGN